MELGIGAGKGLQSLPNPPAPGWVGSCRRPPGVPGEHCQRVPGNRSNRELPWANPRFPEGETEAASGSLALWGLGFVPATSFSPCGDRGSWGGGGAGRGPSGWACQLAESASPAPFAGVAWSPGECDLLTKVACCLHSTAGGGGGGVEREPSAPFSPSGASVSPSAK